ncbi:MAG: flagellar hook-associated protein FlgK [Bacillota bacterium]
MPGTFFGLEIGRRGIQNHQRALDVTGHNLANSSTEGYSRQEAVFTQTDPYTRPDWDSAASPGQLGTGLKTQLIRRVRDEYMDPQVRIASTGRYYWDDQISIFKRVESSFAEPAASGVEDQLVDFFKGWQNLNNNPQDPGVKASVMEMGVQLSSRLTYTYNQLSYIQDSVMKPGTLPDVDSGQIKDQVERINDLLAQVQNYTADMMKIYRLGQRPNDLEDKRDLVLDELSKYGPLTVQHHTQDGKPTGEITMSFFGVSITTVPRDDKTFSLRINDVPGPDFGNLELHEAGVGRVIDLTAERNNYNKGGSLLGIERTRQEIIGFKNTLNDMAVTLRSKIRSVNLAPPPAGTPDFFTGSLSTGDFTVNAAVINAPNVIDGTKAGSIADIRRNDMTITLAEDPVAFGELSDPSRDYTLEECYQLLATDVGDKAKGADGMAASQQAIQEQMKNLRESVSGVSVDEELTKMIQYQYGYQGSARVVGMVDEILDYLINRMKNF